MLLNLLPGYRAWQERREAMRELGRMQDQEEWELALSNTNPVNLALVALELNDKREAATQWEEALSRHPKFAKAHHDSLKVLLGLERWDEAEKLMLEGQKRAPRESFWFAGYASVPERRHHWEEAIKRWSQVRKKFPNYWRAWVQEASCLRLANRSDEAEALLAKAVQVVPDRIEPRLEQARIAEQREDWPKALEIWQFTEEKWRYAGGAIGAARAMHAMGRDDEAEQHLKDWRMLHPIITEIPVALAELALSRGNTDEALRWWKFLRDRFPLAHVGYQGEAKLLCELKRYAEAEEVLLAAIDRFPRESWPSAAYAEVAATREDWAEAISRWEAMRKGWPGRHEGYLRAAEALSHLGQDEEAAALRDTYRQRITS